MMRFLPLLHPLLATVMPPHLADAPTPLTFMRSYGGKADPVTLLTWGLLAISIIVVIIITVMVVASVRRRSIRFSGEMDRSSVQRTAKGGLFVGVAVGISSIVLFGSMIWTVVVLAAINGPAQKPPLTIEITGQQWWWQARYLNDDASHILTTSNEIHIPIGTPVRIRLKSRDVIHSFWVPALTGKTELIPGVTNVTWLEAAKPGTYLGQCSEYCGDQHAHMGFLVVAQSPQDFQKWFDAQLQPATAPASTALMQGQKEFTQHCGVCHTVRGSRAGGTIAPDLTHLMSRTMLASNTLRNTPANLSAWIANPQAQKPGTTMPELYLSGAQLTDITNYLRTLK
jgi:cytochrome c oxidase subunit 2